MNETKFTLTERLILKNQYEILEILSRAFPTIAQRGHQLFHDADQYARFQLVLTRGYDLTLSEVTEGMWEVALSLQEQREILEILDMWRDIQVSFDQLEDKAGITERQILFDGWDGNSMKGELGFARTFCYRQESDWAGQEEVRPDRYAMIRPSPAHNSHSPTVEVYRRMLKEYRPIREAKHEIGWRTLTADEIKQVLEARIHPDYRKEHPGES